MRRRCRPAVPPCRTNAKLSAHRDALSDLALHFLNKMKIMVVKEIEREDIEFICKVSVDVFCSSRCEE